MTTPEEASQKKIEVENCKYGALTMLIGIAAAAGSLALPNHNQQVRELRAGLEIGGLVVMVKGMAQTLDASDRLDRLETKK